jgi:hypothetical protein
MAMLEEFVAAFDLWIVAGVEVAMPQFRLMTTEQQQLVKARQLTAKQYVTHVRRLLGGLPPKPTAIRPVILVQ